MKLVTKRACFRPLAFVAALLIHVPSCYSWRATSLREEPAPDHSRNVRLTLADGRTVVLQEVEFASDTVRGARVGNRREIIAVPARDIRRVEVRSGVDALRTTALVLGLVAAGVIIAAWVYDPPLQDF